jgi:hypothetical protein
MSRQNPRLGSTCPIHQTLLGQFPIAVGKLTTGEDIAPMLLSSSWLQDPIFDSFARHTAEFRFAQQFDRAGVSAGGALPWIWLCTVLPIVARSCGVKGVISSHG